MEKGALIFLAVLLFWAPCLPASLTWAHAGADGGDWAAAALRGALPHPPGAPLYHLLTRLFVRLPGDPAHNLSLLSLLMAALSAALVTAALTPLGTAPALGTGMLLALSPALASQSLIVEVYTTAAACMAALVYLSRRAAPPWLLGLVWGLGLSVHFSLVWAVFWLFLMRATWRERLTLLSVALVVALAMYSSALLILGRGAPSPWAELSTPAGWWTYVSATLYHGYLFALPLASWPQRLLAGLGWWARQFTPLGALLILVGGRRPLPRAERGAFLSLLAATFYSLGYNTPDAWVNLVAYLPLAATLLASGWQRVDARLRRWKWPWLALVVCFAALVTRPQVCLRGADEAARWAAATLEAAPDDAVLCSHADGATFALWYAQALGLRPDVQVLDVDLLAYAPYRRYLVAQGLVPETAIASCVDVNVPAPAP